MKDARCGQKVRRETSESIPSGVVLLAAALKRTSPKVHDMVPKCTQACDVGWHCVVGEVTAHHLAQPLTLLRAGGLTHRRRSAVRFAAMQSFTMDVVLRAVAGVSRLKTEQLET